MKQRQWYRRRLSLGWRHAASIAVTTCNWMLLVRVNPFGTARSAARIGRGSHHQREGYFCDMHLPNLYIRGNETADVREVLGPKPAPSSASKSLQVKCAGQICPRTCTVVVSGNRIEFPDGWTFVEGHFCSHVLVALCPSHIETGYYQKPIPAWRPCIAGHWQAPPENGVCCVPGCNCGFE